MATIDLGKIKLVWRGTYDGATAYTVDDVVQHTDSGLTSSFICTTASTGNAPSTSGTVHGSWAYLAKGAAGSVLTTQGDILYRDGSGDQRLAKPASDKFLQNTSGGVLSWADAGGGKILQVLTANDNTLYAGSSDLVEYTELELTMTPSATSSKILVSLNLGLLGADSGADFGVQIKRTIGSGSASTLQSGSAGSQCTFVPAMSFIGSGNGLGASHTIIDAPNTTDACKYEVVMDINSPRTIYINRRNSDTSFTSSSSMHLMEIGA